MILIIDDNSPDGTREIADTLAVNINKLKLYIEPQTWAWFAYVAGFKYALKQDVDYILEMDADFSHDQK